MFSYIVNHQSLHGPIPYKVKPLDVTSINAKIPASKIKVRDSLQEVTLYT